MTLDVVMSGGVLGLESLAGPLVALFAVGIALLLLILGLADQRILLVTGFLFYSAQMFNAAVLPQFTMLYALLAFVYVGMAAMIRGRMPRFDLLTTGIFPAIFVWAALALLLMSRSADAANTLSTVALVIYLAGFCWVVLSAADAEEIRWALRVCMGLIMGVSVIMVYVMPEAAIGGYQLDIVANRWRGLTQNPNGLSTFTGIFVVLAVTPATAVRSLVPAVIILLGTASRSVALALGVVMGPQVLRGASRAAQRVVLILALLVAVPLVYSVLTAEDTGPVDISNQALIRTDNTRDKSWSGAIDAITANPIGGLGAGNDQLSTEEAIPVSSSVLRPVTELGYPGLIPVVMVAFVGIRAARRGPTPFRTLFGFMVIHGVFEGWIFAGGSMLFVVFVLAATLMELEQKRLRRQSQPVLAVQPVPAAV